MRAHFALAEGYANLNHGSYGSPPLSVLKTATATRMHIEANPDAWFRYEMCSALDKVRSKIAAYVGADTDDVVFVDNASHGVNSVLRSLEVTQGQKNSFPLQCVPDGQEYAYIPREI